MFIELKPCPFCGGHARLARHSKTIFAGETHRNTYVYCSVCQSRGQRFLYQEFAAPLEAHQAAIDAWNGRVGND